MDFYLGLTGLPGAGKDAVSRLIAAELAAHGIQTLHYSLSGPIDLERRRRGLPLDREQLRFVANEVRASLGNGAWATRTAREIHETLAATLTAIPSGTLSSTQSTKMFVMIDGVRNPAEIDVFKELWGSRFHLLAVSAPEVVRRRNLTARSSPKDAAVLAHLAGSPTDSPLNSAAIAPVLTAEMGIGQPQHGTNVLACIERADWTLENAEHDEAMTALREQVRGLVERLVLPLYRRPGAGPSIAASTVREWAHTPGADASGSTGASTVREWARALVVDSDPAWRERLAGLLEQEGCMVEFAADYAEASRKLLAHRPYQLLMVDLHLHEPASNGGGEAGGFDLLQSLHYFDRSLPSIIVTAHAEPGQVSRAFRDLDVRDCYAKQHFAADAFRARVRTLLQRPFYAVAALEAPAAGYLVAGRPYALTIRLQRDAPLHSPPLGGVLALLRPCTAADWLLEVALNSPGLRLDVQPGANQQLAVPASYLAEPLTCTITPLAAGNGRLELQFHRPGQFVDRLVLDLSVHTE